MEDLKACPYCGKPMEVGYMEQSRFGRFTWVPETENYSVTALWKKTAIKIGVFDGLLGGIAKIYCCRECQKMVIDLKDDF
ncbi:MAG: PF20097 family protein [Desulfosporosinus sp.]|jgi:hypothetical protein|nr:PF20097 family protein [Desulfosporosinus sp.]